MANTKHAIVRTDNMSATTDGSLIISGRFYVSSDTAEIDNGNLVEIGGYDTNEREVRKVTAPTSATVPIANLGLVVTPETFYDTSVTHTLEEYVNEAGKAITIMRFHNNDIFSVTTEAITGTPALDKYLVCGTTTKFTVADSVTAGATTIGKIVEIETSGSYTYYVVQVTM